MIGKKSVKSHFTSFFFRNHGKSLIRLIMISRRERGVKWVRVRFHLEITKEQVPLSRTRDWYDLEMAVACTAASTRPNIAEAKSILCSNAKIVQP